MRLLILPAQREFSHHDSYIKTKLKGGNSLTVTVGSNQRVYLNRKLVRNRNSSSVIHGRDFGSSPHSAQFEIIAVGLTDNIRRSDKWPHCILRCRSIKAHAANGSLTNYPPITHCSGRRRARRPAARNHALLIPSP